MTHQESGDRRTANKWLTCNGRQLRKLVQASLRWLEAHYLEVNELNVFPVPDGDTGTNMLLTLRSACRGIENDDEMHVGRVADRVAKGALMGARGNSGVILSQIYRGLAKSLHEMESFNARSLADAFRQAADTAYGGVMRPVEGTILTVIREGADEAADAAQKSDDLRFVLERVLERCQQSLERTPDLLPILKQAGVVDSGGKGLVYIFEGMLRYVHGNVPDLGTPGLETVQPPPAQMLAMPAGGNLEFPYDVQFILLGKQMNVTKIRDTIDAMGDSTVVVGDEETIKVHVHVADPGRPISYGISIGHVTDVVVENMQMQMESIVGSREEESAPAPPLEPGQIGIVAVTAGEGLANIFRSLGATLIVNGGQTNNPSIEELFQAIQDIPSNRVILLPNNKNILLAAEAAAELSPKEVAVVPTRTAPQGIGALLQLDRDGDLSAISAAMEQGAREIGTGEITIATRSVTIDGVEVAEGEHIGLADGRLCGSGPAVKEVVDATLNALDIDERELISIYYGEAISAAEAQLIANHIADRYPDLEVELLSGGQAHYDYIFGVE